VVAMRPAKLTRFRCSTRPAPTLNLRSTCGNKHRRKNHRHGGRYFEQSWRVVCFGGFLFGREAAAAWAEGQGYAAVHRASASVRGRSATVPQARRSGPADTGAGDGERNMPPTASRRPRGVDGAIGGEKIRPGSPKQLARRTLDSASRASSMALCSLHKQPPRAWSFELDVRTSHEKW